MALNKLQAAVLGDSINTLSPDLVDLGIDSADDVIDNVAAFLANPRVKSAIVDKIQEWLPWYADPFVPRAYDWIVKAVDSFNVRKK